MDNTSVRIYLFTGFLESGKTTFIADTILNTDFCENEKTVLIVSEEGEVSYSQEEIEARNVDIVMVDDEDAIDKDFYLNIAKKYDPTQIIFELNGMWNVNRIMACSKPAGWDIVQILTTIDASTFNLYVQNMRGQLFQHCAHSDLVIFNRIQEGMKKSVMRNNIKAMNSTVQIIYENEDGTVNNMPDDELPYDYTQDTLDIADHNFGIFCYDAMEHPERYDHKHLKIKGKFIGRDKIMDNGFIIGRYAMVCCEQDTSLIGMLCTSPYASKLLPNEWLQLEGTTRIEYDQELGGNICILDVEKLEGCSPLANEYVTFD